MFLCRRGGPWQDCGAKRTCFVLNCELVVQIKLRRRKYLSRLTLVLHRVSALPAESVLLFDLRSAFRTGSDAWRLFLRCDHGLGLRFFFTLSDRRWRRLYDGRGRLLLRLLFDHFESACGYQNPAVTRTRHKRRLEDLHVASVGIGAVIVILVELVEVTLRRKLRRSRQHDRLVLTSDDYKLTVFYGHERTCLVVKSDAYLVGCLGSLQV